MVGNLQVNLALEGFEFLHSEPEGGVVTGKAGPQRVVAPLGIVVRPR